MSTSFALSRLPAVHSVVREGRRASGFFRAAPPLVSRAAGLARRHCRPGPSRAIVSKRMTYIDSAILDLTEWFCRKFQVLTGRTNAWLAVQFTNLSIVMYFVWAGVYFWNSDVEARVAVGLFCGALLYVLTQTVFKVPIEAYEQEAYRRVAKGLRNPRRLRDAPLRISFLTLSLLLFVPMLLLYTNLRVRVAPLTYSLITLTTVVLYLVACDPLPPCAGKVTEWFRAAGRLRTPRAAPVKAPTGPVAQPD